MSKTITSTYENILVEEERPLAIVRLNRPKVFNALSHALISELVSAFEQLDRDSNIRVIILTGNERAFAAGADVKEMLPESSVSILLKDQFATWDKIRLTKKPIIAAPVTTTTAISSSLAASKKALLSSCRVVKSKQLRTSGRLIVTLAMKFCLS